MTDELPINLFARRSKLLTLFHRKPLNGVYSSVKKKRAHLIVEEKTRLKDNYFITIGNYLIISNLTFAFEKYEVFAISIEIAYIL